MPPTRHALALVALGVVAACDVFEDVPDFEPAPRNCDPRVAYWLDADADGVGGDDEVYLGCEAIDGYVETSGDCDDADPLVTEGCDTATPDTGDPDTGDPDTGNPDTGDTDTGDTDTAAPDTGTDTSDTSTDTSVDTSADDTALVDTGGTG